MQYVIVWFFLEVTPSEQTVTRTKCIKNVSNYSFNTLGWRLGSSKFNLSTVTIDEGTINI